MSNKGLSKPYIVPANNAINSDTYINQCLRLRLLPFINQHHINQEYIFWPDLAPCHYSNTSVAFMTNNNIHFVPKNKNPPAVPECRAIEDFWGILKIQVHKNNRQVKDLV